MKKSSIFVFVCFLLILAMNCANPCVMAAEPVPGGAIENKTLAKIESILQEADVQRYLVVFVHKGRRFSIGKGQIAEAVSKKLQGTGEPDEAMVELFDFLKDAREWMLSGEK